MQCLQNYGTSSESDSDSEDKFSHLKPIDASSSVAKTLSVVAAPDVVPMVSTEDARIADSQLFVCLATACECASST